MNSYELAAMSLAATDLEKMVLFYSEVFGVEFSRIDIGDDRVYEGDLAGIEFAIYRAEGQPTPSRNPLHFEFFFPDLQVSVDAAVSHGGRTNGQPMEDDEVRAVGVFDPDGNFMVFKQRK